MTPSNISDTTFEYEAKQKKNELNIPDPDIFGLDFG